MGIRERINHLLATGFLAGRIRYMPGTFGSLVGLLLVFLFPILRSWPAILITVIAGTYICQQEENRTGVKDNQEIVIDEIAGVFITFALISPNNFIHYLTGFLLFRVFDIFKPGPIDSVQDYEGGPGVMLDDIAAGLISAIIMFLIF
ncbi:MAG: phosphatidylglycerophosphatase A [Bacillota bacterium]